LGWRPRRSTKGTHIESVYGAFLRLN